MTPLILPSFAAGEISPALHGRVDLSKYQVALGTCLNWMIHAFGGASTRAGTAFVGEVYDHAERSRLIPFAFSTTQTYVLEFGDQVMRVIKDGGYVLETGVTITGISAANPGVVTAAAHGLSNGDHVWIDGVAGMSEINRRRFTVANAAANTFELSGVDTSAYTAWVSGGTVSRFYTIATPYLVADLPLLKFVQSADTMTLTHPSYAPRNLTRTGHAAWTLTAITFAPLQQPPTALASTAAGVGFDYTVTAINDDTGEESLAATPVSATTQTSTLTWTDAAGATKVNVYKAKNGIYGFIGQGGLGANGFTDATINPDVSDTPPGARNPFSGANLWPGTSTYHDGRQFFARSNTYPQTIWGSSSANFRNMNVAQPARDSDAITRTIASREVNEIRHLLSFNDLLVFTSGAVWKAWAGSQSDVMTPANFNVKPQSYEGAAHVPPIASETSVLYVTASGRKVRDVAYEFSSDSFGGRNLSILAQHLFEGLQIEEWAYARDPDSIVWCVRSDGVLLGFTYLKEHDVYAWSRHTTDGTVESVCCIQEGNETALYLIVNRTLDGVTMRYVERMASRYFPDVSQAWCVDSGFSYDGWNTDETRFLHIEAVTDYEPGATVLVKADGHTPFSSASVGKKYMLRNGVNTTTVTITVFNTPGSCDATIDAYQTPHASLQGLDTFDWAVAIESLAGFWHLEGKTVAILADGSVQPSVVVQDGTITIPRASGRITAGLPYICDLETLDIERGPPTLQGRQKRVQEVVLRVKDTRGLSVGADFDRLVEIKERTTENYGVPTALTTGDERVLIDPLWSSNGRVAVRQAFPLPATVVAIIPRMEVGE